MGCGRTLFLAEGGYVTCSYHRCPDPCALDTIIDDEEKEHVVSIQDRTFTVRHPLRERVDDAMLDCTLHSWVAGLDGPPRAPGRYRVSGDQWQHWQELQP